VSPTTLKLTLLRPDKQLSFARRRTDSTIANGCPWVTLPSLEEVLVPPVRRTAAIVLAVLCTACAGAGSGESLNPSTAADSAPDTPSVVATESTQASVAPPSPSGTPAEYATSVFQPPFTVALPAGWIVAERHADIVQIFQGCSTCLYDGEENGAITIDMTSAGMTVDEAIATLQDAASLDPGDVVPVELGELSGLMFTGTRSGPSDVTFQPSGYHTSPFGDPIDVYALTFGGKTATVFVDPHEAEGDAGGAFRDAATQIIETIRIAP